MKFIGPQWQAQANSGGSSNDSCIKFSSTKPSNFTDGLWIKDTNSNNKSIYIVDDSAIEFIKGYTSTLLDNDMTSTYQGQYNKTFFNNNKIYICYSVNIIYIYDIQTKIKSQRSVDFTYNGSMGFYDNKIVRFGGYSTAPGSHSDQTYYYDYTNIKMYDITTSTMTNRSATCSSYSNTTPIVGLNNYMYKFGGVGYTGMNGGKSSTSKEYYYNSNNIQKYDITNDTITTLSATLPQQMYNMGKANIGNSIYLFGGIHQTGWYTNGASYNLDYTTYSYIQRFDTSTNTISTVNTLSSNYSGVNACAIGSIVVLAIHGGTKQVAIYDISTNTITYNYDLLYENYNGLTMVTDGTDNIYALHYCDSSYSSTNTNLYYLTNILYGNTNNLSTTKYNNKILLALDSAKGTPTPLFKFGDIYDYRSIYRVYDIDSSAISTQLNFSKIENDVEI